MYYSKILNSKYAVIIKKVRESKVEFNIQN